MTGPASTPATAPAPVAVPAPVTAPAKLRRRSRSAVARSTGGDRWMTIVLGLLLLAAGAGVALLSYGVFGAARASRPLLDPVVVDALRAQPLLARTVAIAAGVALALVGLVWAARSLRPERRPDVTLDTGPDTTIVISATAAADAVGAQAEELPGVGRAKARVVGTDAAPALRVTVWLTEEADVREVVRLLDEQVLAGARTSFGLETLPVAVRLELEAQPAGRVA